VVDREILVRASAVGSGLCQLWRERSRAVRRVSSHYPLYRGHGRIANTILGRVAPVVAADDVPVSLRAGPLIYLHPNEYVGRTVYFFGDLDPKVTWVCARLLRPGDTFVDVGASYGVLALRAAQLVGPSGAVHAFEPQPKVAACLRKSVIANGFGQLTLHEVALSNRDGFRELRVPVDNCGAASLSRMAAGSSETLRVPIRRSGVYLSALGTRPVRVLKLDIEGHEEQFLAGAVDFLRTQPPDAIVFESNDDVRPFWGRPAIQTLVELDYELIAIGRTATSTVRMELTPLLPGAEPARSLDFVAVRRSQYSSITAELSMGRRIRGSQAGRS
jgi:FkbM family methyltransferase